MHLRVQRHVSATVMCWLFKHARFPLISVVDSLTSADICYDLYAVSNHTGSLDAGHYTADVRHFASQQWFHCNDRR